MEYIRKEKFLKFFCVVMRICMSSYTLKFFKLSNKKLQDRRKWAFLFAHEILYIDCQFYFRIEPNYDCIAIK